MELEEPRDPKMRLLQKSAMHREHLEDEVKYISDRTERILTNALIIGGTLAATYLVLKIFTSSDKKKLKSAKSRSAQTESGTINAAADETEDVGTSVLAQVGTALATQGALLLLDLAKEKLTEYIQSQAVRNRENDGRA